MIKAVKGMNDIFGKESLFWSKIEEDLRTILWHFNYNEIRTPIVEDLALFKRGVGNTTDVVQKEMYDFEDKKGRKLALRPEGTASVVRALIEHRFDLEKPMPQKYFYIGPNFRYERPQKGRYRQFHQLGLEIFGDSTPEMDAELIFTASKILKHFKIDFKILINSIGCPICRTTYKEKLQNFFKDEENLCNDCIVRIKTNPLRVLDCKICNHKEKEGIPILTENLCENCSNDFERLKNALDIFEVKYEINPFIVRGLDYYTKTAFEIVANTGGSQNSIAGGGRYDYLVKNLGGPNIPATGFAIGLERMIDLIPRDFYKEEPLAMAFTLFEGGINDLVHFAKHISHHPIKLLTDYTPKKMNKLLKKSNKLNVRHLFIFGEDEVKNKTVVYKDLKTKEQQIFAQYETMKIVDLILKKNIEL